MIVWGIVSSCTMFVQGPASFYTVRFLLGVVESGFFPGVILYLTFWYTQPPPRQMVALFMSAIPLSGVIAGPISGWILKSMSGVGHLAAWQWLFLIEGIPSVLAGLVTLYFLTDSPAKANWLDSSEKELSLESGYRKRKRSRSARARTPPPGGRVSQRGRSGCSAWSTLESPWATTDSDSGCRR